MRYLRLLRTLKPPKVNKQLLTLGPAFLSACSCLGGAPIRCVDVEVDISYIGVDWRNSFYSGDASWENLL